MGHCLERYKGNGRCRSLTGVVFWTFVYINDSVSNWTIQEKQKQEKINLEVMQYLKESAKKEQIDLRMFLKSFDVKLTYEVRQDNYSNLMQSCADAIGKASLSEFDLQLQNQHPGCQNFYIFLLNKQKRSNASPSTGAPISEYCMIYDRSFYTLLHEVLHVFGAADYYYPDQVKHAAINILKESVMLQQSNVIDDLTKYLIGWHAKPSKQAQLLLDATSYITEDMVRDSLNKQYKNGHGRIEYVNGCVYEGNLKEGLPEGKGKMLYTNGTIYEGDFVMGEPHGYGTYRFQSGTVYKGDVSHGKLTGKGSMTYKDGTTFEGDFVNSEPHGYGIYRYQEGTVYKGDMSHGKLTGKGSMTYKDGTTFEGDFVNSMPHGYGIYRYQNGTVYEGEVVHGKVEGEGCMKYSNGAVRKGYFKNGKYKGKGIFRKLFS